MSIDNLMSWEEIRSFLSKKYKGGMWSKYERVVNIFQNSANYYNKLGYGPVDSANKAQLKTQRYISNLK